MKPGERACANCKHWQPDDLSRCWGYCSVLDMRSPACACCRYDFGPRVA